ncbi:hypothetical protein Y032_0003g1309 [Ancylostoma ceylanicum]|nr:hypothetical protein Y032_0003g1309 [Ancylostoma ceylanicum]
MQERSKFWNGTLYMSEVIESLHPYHPLYLLYNKSLLRYDFGSTYFNYCELRKQPRKSLPSLPRILEMKIASQACLRVIVLVGVNIKMVMTMAQANADYFFAGERRILWYLSRLLPWLEISASSVLMLIVCLQQDQDKNMWRVMHYNLPVFAVLFFAQGFIYSVLEVVKSRSKVRLTIGGGIIS